MDNRNPVNDCLQVIRDDDGTCIGLLKPVQVDHIKTKRLISGKIIWAGLLFMYVSKLNLGPNNLTGSIKIKIQIPGLPDAKGLLVLSVPVTVHILKDLTPREIEVQIREY